MSLTVMNFNRIRELVSNLGCMNEDNAYILSLDCLKILEKLEDELRNEDVVSRNVRISLHICGTVKEDLIPILTHGRDFKILATATRVLVSLSLPAECLLQFEEAALSPKHLNIYTQLAVSTLAIKKAFLNASATSPIVSMLRETVMKSEKHLIPLKDKECEHLYNCLTFLCNLLHLPENLSNLDKNCIPKYADWQSVQNKLIWNLFVQGFDGALILMLNSKYKEHWTVPLTLTIALLFRNQNIGKIHQSLELVSSASESSGDEESDASKISSFSLSSEYSKNVNLLSDSGCPLTSESSYICSDGSVKKCFPSSAAEIHETFEKVQISDAANDMKPKIKANLKTVCNPPSNSQYFDNDCESSSSSESPYHKKIKGSTSASEAKCDSGMDYSSLEGKSSDEDNFNEKRVVDNLKAVQKLKSVQMQSKLSESDSSNEDFQMIKIKQRSHPPPGRRGKSPRRKDGCIPFVCIESALATSSSKGRIKYPLWEKRSSISTLIDVNSSAPSDDDIGFLLKEFTLSFLHSGFSDLAVKIKELLLKGSPVGIDKSVLFWMLSYFLHLAGSVNLSFNHISPILSSDFVTFLIFECVNACENMELHFNSNDVVKKYLSVHLNLIVTAFKEIMSTIDLYFRKSCSQKDKMLFNELYGRLSSMQCFRQIPLLLFQICSKYNSKQFLEDVTILNHHTMIAIDRGSSYSSQHKKINMVSHLQQFATKNIVECCRKVLENFKFNSHFLNECVFTLLHHIAGDLHSSHLLIEPSLLKVFSEILKEDIELDQYQEDLIMYILTKFSREVQTKFIKEQQIKKGGSKLSDDSSINSSVSSHCLLIEEDDDLFWWYLQFEQDKDPVSRISEHLPTSKQDILSKLQIKGFVSVEKLKLLKEKMKAAQDSKLEAIPNEDLSQISIFDDDVTLLLRTLVQAGERQHLIWLQDVLLETCYVKLGLNEDAAESIVLHSINIMMPVPVIPFTCEQRAILKNKSFVLLLQKIGLHPGTSDCLIYPRIPLSWTVDILFSVAARLGPIKKEKMKFSYEELLDAFSKIDPLTRKEINCLALPPLSSCCTMSSWLAMVQQNKEHFISTKGNN